MEFKIVENVTKPAIKRGNSGRQTSYPFKTMTVGASFFVEFTVTGNKEKDKEEQDKIVRRIRTAVLTFKDKNPTTQFTTLTTDQYPDHVGKLGLGVWRDADKEEQKSA